MQGSETKPSTKDLPHFLYLTLRPLYLAGAFRIAAHFGHSTAGMARPLASTQAGNVVQLDSRKPTIF